MSGGLYSRHGKSRWDLNQICERALITYLKETQTKNKITTVRELRPFLSIEQKHGSYLAAYFLRMSEKKNPHGLKISRIKSRNKKEAKYQIDFLGDL